MSDSPSAPPAHLSTAGAAALYIGALLGPSMLLLPGLAVRKAGPASLLVWLALLVLSGLVAAVFSRLGIRMGSTVGAAGYTAAGLGPRAGHAAAWCFLAGVVTGAPVVCLIGGAYVAELLGGGTRAAFAAAVCLLVLVLASDWSACGRAPHSSWRWWPCSSPWWCSLWPVRPPRRTPATGRRSPRTGGPESRGRPPR
ncbi:amino acid permease [Streptomyces sp. NPDC006990]|uniref:amino acid permease n=1 Tax=unclassified Streptomyces TaxID=2593676 RepID=UPI003453A3C0